MKFESWDWIGNLLLSICFDRVLMQYIIIPTSRIRQKEQELYSLFCSFLFFFFLCLVLNPCGVRQYVLHYCVLIAYNQSEWVHLIMPLFSSSPSFLTWKNFILSACLHFLFTFSVVDLKHTQKLLPNTPEITWKIKSEREEGRNCGLDLLKNIVLFVVGHINSYIITNQNEYSLLCPC